MLDKPQLIDKIIGRYDLFDTKVLIDGKWYISSNLPNYGWRNTINRIYHSYLILTGKAIAIQFAEDRFDNKNKDSWMIKRICLECGAETPEQSETMCICSGDKDHCHGCELWPDD